MKIAELLTLPEAANLTVQVSIGDLRLFHEEIVQKQLSQQKELNQNRRRTTHGYRGHEFSKGESYLPIPLAKKRLPGTH